MARAAHASESTWGSHFDEMLAQYDAPVFEAFLADAPEPPVSRRDALVERFYDSADRLGEILETARAHGRAILAVAVGLLLAATALLVRPALAVWVLFGACLAVGVLAYRLRERREQARALADSRPIYPPGPRRVPIDVLLGPSDEYRLQR